jgi:hypothetical protein
LALDNTNHPVRRRLRARATGHDFLGLWKAYGYYRLDEEGEVHVKLKQLTSAPENEQKFTETLTADAQLAWDFHITGRTTLQYASYSTTTKEYMGCGPRYPNDCKDADSPPCARRGFSCNYIRNAHAIPSTTSTVKRRLSACWAMLCSRRDEEGRGRAAGGLDECSGDDLTRLEG